MTAEVPLNPTLPDHPFRVMIVDDSTIIRRLIGRVFRNRPEFQIVATAENGRQAIEQLRAQLVDVVILDIEMPVMDGLTAIPQLKAVDPSVQIIMASTLTQKNAEISLRALSLGATDYIPKPSGLTEATSDFNTELLEKTKALALLARRKRGRLKPGPVAAVPKAAPRLSLRPKPLFGPSVIAIGSSTGGPEALIKVIGALGDVPQPVVITQHMPPTFTSILAANITRQCNVACSEGKDGEPLLPHHYYLAPGDYHMLVVKKGEQPALKIVQDPRENYCRPAVDPMLRSLVEVFGRRILVVMLTGMGQDGCKGSEQVVAAGGCVVAQDETSSVVWGMPGAVALAGLCSYVLPLDEIGATVRKLTFGAAP